MDNDRDQQTSSPVSSTDSEAILLVDDDPDELALMTRILRREGRSITASGGGEEALRELGGHAFDLMVLDLYMPDLNGWQTCQKLSI